MEENKQTDQTYDPLEEHVIHKTSNYSLFNYIESNRTVSKPHVQHLIRSMGENPQLMATRPILVNENMEIIDGQHRLQAAMTLRVPVYYTVAKGTNVESAQLMNALQRGWSLTDYARSHALNTADPVKQKTYRTFLQLHEEYSVPVTLLIAICEQKKRHSQNKSFKQGALTIKNEEVTRAWLDMLVDFRDIVGRAIFSRSTFQNAVFYIFQNEKYDHERMIQKLKEKRLEPQLTRVDYMRKLEEIYNDKLSDEKRVRFF